MFTPEQLRAAKDVVQRCQAAGLRLSIAESCTGGLIAACLTSVPGSSQVFDRGFITYADNAKIDMLGVPRALLLACGAVSEEVARFMAEGALAHSDAQVSVAVTGIAGPGGQTNTKPVGLVHIAAARSGCSTLHANLVFQGDRHAVRSSAVEAAFSLLDEILSGQNLV